MRMTGAFLTLIITAASTGFSQTPGIVARVDNELNLKRLQGTWVPEFLITDAGLEAYPLKGRSMIIADLAFARFDGTKNVQSGSLTFYIGDGASIDFVINDRLDWDFERLNHTPDKVLRRQKALFKIEGDVLTIAYPVPGRNRPDDLKAASHRQVIVYKRLVDKVDGGKDPQPEPKVETPPIPQVQPQPKTEQIPLPVVAPKQPRKRNKVDNP